MHVGDDILLLNKRTDWSRRVCKCAVRVLRERARVEWSGSASVLCVYVCVPGGDVLSRTPPYRHALLF